MSSPLFKYPRGEKLTLGVAYSGVLGEDVFAAILDDAINGASCGCCMYTCPSLFFDGDVINGRLALESACGRAQCKGDYSWSVRRKTWASYDSDIFDASI